MSERPAHAPIAHFPVHDGVLHVGGVPLPLLALRVGQTPFYAYDRGVIAGRVAALRDALPPAIELHYAIKANPMPAVVQHLAGLVDGFDVASLGELRVVLDAGAAPDTVSFAGPGKQDVELRAAVAAGITLHVESAAELERVAAIGNEVGRQPRVALRVNPDFELKGSGMRMGGGAKVFGIDAEIVPALLPRVADLGLHFAGFHIFWGSQNLRADAIVDAQARSFALAERLAAEADVDIDILNIGGGFGIPYFPGDMPLDLEAVGAALGPRLDAFHTRYPRARVVLELGRYLVGEAGVYVCRVVERKVSRGQVFLVTDGGLHHHLAASGNFGQVIRKNYPVALAHDASGEREQVTVTGPLCTPLDLLAERMELPRAQAGDLVVVFHSGAYGLSASPTAFLSHPAPLEVLV